MVLYADKLPVSFIMYEDEIAFSREHIVIGASQTLKAGTILGKRDVVANLAAAASVGGSNTGNATIAMDGTTPLTAAAVNGRYRGVAITATTVQWEDPNGKNLGVSTHGIAFAKGGVKFTITAGGSANVAGDEFYVDVVVEQPGDVEYVVLNPSATDGTQNAAAINLYPVTTGSGETKKVTGLVRHAVVNGNELTWPNAISADNKAKAIEQLRALGVLVRN